MSTDSSASLVIRRQGDVTLVGFTSPYLQSDEVATRLGAELTRLVEGKEGVKLVVSFDGVRFLSSSMLAQVIKLHKTVTKGKGRLRLCSLGPTLRDLIKAGHLDRMLDIHADEAAALAKF